MDGRHSRQCGRKPPHERRSHGHGYGQNLVSVTCLDEDGEIRSHTREELNAQYRSIPDLVHNFVLQAVFEAQPAPAEEMERLLEAARARRKLSQPVGASAGCIFKTRRKSRQAGSLMNWG